MSESIPAQPADYFIPAGNGSKHTIFPGVNIVTTCGESMLFSVVHLELGSVVLEHSHHHEQMGTLISGKLEFTIGGITQVLSPGDVWRIPGNVLHRVVALEKSVAIDVFHPIREDYR